MFFSPIDVTFFFWCYFRYAGFLGSIWQATNGLLQGDPLSVVIPNCVLKPLVTKLENIPGISVFAFADYLTVVASSCWDTLLEAFALLVSFCQSTDLVLILSKCKLWNKGIPIGTYPSVFDQLSFCFYPFSLGAPIDIGVPYDAALQVQDATAIHRAKKIAKLDLPYDVSYRLFVSLVSSFCNHFALACGIRTAQSTSLKHAITSILVPKQVGVSRVLYSLVTPGHLLSRGLFLNYRHIVVYILHVQLLLTSIDEPSYLYGNLVFLLRGDPFIAYVKLPFHLGSSSLKIL